MFFLQNEAKCAEEMSDLPGFAFLVFFFFFKAYLEGVRDWGCSLIFSRLFKSELCKLNYVCVEEQTTHVKTLDVCSIGSLGQRDSTSMTKLSQSCCSSKAFLGFFLTFF